MRAEAVAGRRVMGLIRPDVPEHHTLCPACGALLDMRDLAEVLEHDDVCPGLEEGP